jgi:glutamate-5-semialdehyde dehydrogenase
MLTTQDILSRAVAVRSKMSLLTTEQKNEALLAAADALEQATADILRANAEDVDAARERISQVMLDRLTLNADRIAGMAKGIREVAELPDPVGHILSRSERPNGLVI